MSECRHDGGICRHLERIEALLQRQIDMMAQPTEPVAVEMPPDDIIDRIVAKGKQSQRELFAEIDARRAQEHANWHALHDQRPREVN